MQVARVVGGLILMLILLFSFGAGAAEPGRVEVVIRNSAFEVQGGPIRLGAPTVIVIKNLDPMEHGFVSLFLQEADLRVDIGGSAAFGRGIKGVHVGAGSELTIRFIPSQSGRFNFICDLHPNMKGEVALISVTGG